MTATPMSPTVAEAVNVNITVNGQTQQVPAGTDLAGLIDRLGTPPQALATAVNGEFVARGQRTQCLLREGDAVFTFQPITGG